MNRREFVALAPAFPVAAVTASLTLRQDGHEPVDVDVSVLKLQPGDTIVLQCPALISSETAVRLKNQIEHLFPGATAIVLGDGLTITGVLRGPKGA